MQLNKEMIFDNYHERIKRLALFEPLYSLQNKRFTDNKSVSINMFELGLLTLLFFFENKLIRNYKSGIEELSEFLFEMVSERYDIDSKNYSKYARTLIETFRPATGKRLSKSFFNFQTQKEEVLFYSILKAGKSDLANNKQYYELDEDGLELIFSTSEYFSEYQISISQMLLRKQLEKGEFMSALRQIDEMNLNIITLNDRITKIKKEINRNITSETVLYRYKKLIEDINSRLEREDTEFEALREFVIETIKRLKNNTFLEKDKQVYLNALKVSKELEKVHNAHNNLLNESIKIKNSALIAAKESLYYVGVESFNFNKEIVSKIISEPLELDKVQTLAKPFLYTEKSILWSPLAVFFPQRVMNKDDVEFNLEYMEVNETDEEEKRLIEKIFEHIMTLCLNQMSTDHKLLLSDLIKSMENSEYEDILNSRYFYDFWITVHQFSPININYEEDDKTHNILIEALHLLKNRYKSLKITELSKIIKVNDRFSISEMELELEATYEL